MENIKNEKKNIKNPIITIVLATYKPNFKFFKEQLISINEQTYNNLNLIVVDDFSTPEEYSLIKKYLKRYITRISYSISQNSKNMGSNYTFEKLTKKANGDYISFCDQDDIWFPKKIEILYKEIVCNNADIVCSDMYVIDSNGRIISNSIKDIRKTHVFYSGYNLFEKLIFKNWITGCTMLVKSEIAKKAIPFCPYMIHDNYISLFSSIRGNIISLENEKLIKYRVHSSNQTGFLTKINSKDDYYKLRICEPIKRIEWLIDNLKCIDRDQRRTLLDAKIWIIARQSYFKKHKGLKNILKYKYYGSKTVFFEIIMSWFPNTIFMFAISLIRIYNSKYKR